MMSLLRHLFRLQSRFQKPTIRRILPVMQQNVFVSSSSSPSVRSKAAPEPKPTPNYDEGLKSSTKFQYGGSDRDDHDQTDEDHDTEGQELREELLTMALNHVKTTGWNTDAVAMAAEEAGLSPSVSELFSPYDLVHFFISKSNLELEQHLSENPSSSVRQALEFRLNKVIPYVANYSDAIAIITHPQNAGDSIALLQELADSIVHHSLKDASTDINWYTRRMAIGGIYASTELCLIQDKSPGFSETFAFLDRRVKEFDRIKGDFNFNAVSSLPLPELIHAGFTTIRNLMGRNTPR